MDVSKGMVGLAQKYVPYSCPFVVNQTDNLSQFRDDSFDFIYSNIVLQHQPSREIARGYIREFVRFLKTVGNCRISDPLQANSSVCAATEAKIVFLSA